MTRITGLAALTRISPERTWNGRRSYNMRILGRQCARAIAAISFSLLTAMAQRTLPSDIIDLNDPHPLARAAEILTARYGVPISFEDVSNYSYQGDLSDPIKLRVDHPDAKRLPPRN